MTQLILAVLIGMLFGYDIGWTSAHNTVAIECERLGKFFVGKKVFECTKILEIENDQTNR